MTTPAAPGQSKVRTTPRRSTNSTSRASHRTAYCQGWVSARASGMAEPKMAPMAAGPAPSRNPRARGSLRSWPVGVQRLRAASRAVRLDQAVRPRNGQGLSYLRPGTVAGTQEQQPLATPPGAVPWCPERRERDGGQDAPPGPPRPVAHRTSAGPRRSRCHAHRLNRASRRPVPPIAACPGGRTPDSVTGRAGWSILGLAGHCGPARRAAPTATGHPPAAETSARPFRGWAVRGARNDSTSI